ncbi:MAG: biotin--[acetyl-CoA-carboxylase] ligase [Pseudomonadota bacterium]|nr:biotin--[acetyl-CoA-carboxylase] ligase [Pseudomonadota bacterium]
MKKQFFDYHFFKSLENTNDEIKKINLIRGKNNNLALFSKIQSKGRGRSSKKWISHKGDLTCSFLINKELEIKEVGRVNLIVAISIIEIFKNIGLKEEINFKWPNDIFIRKKKIAGVLIETNILKNKIQNLTIGIGVNFISKSIDGKYPPISISNLKLRIDPINFFFMISNNLSLYFNDYERLDFQKLSLVLSRYFLYSKRLVKIKKAGNHIQGNFVRINSYGKLILKNNSEKYEINYGELL